MTPTIHFVFNLLDYSFGDSNGKSVRIEIEERLYEERITKKSFQSRAQSAIEGTRVCFSESIGKSIGENACRQKSSAL
ncbi:MAG: hypothetical protein JNN25_11465 [Candidatus Kapabacteria bacterium]|nr:hypothetical protein [Candidatus Kapabacteria bacterium]